MGYFICACATVFYHFPSEMLSHKWRIERGRELLVAKPLIVHINNIATEMLNKSEPHEAYPSEGFTGTVGMKHILVWTRGTRFRHV